jgi:glycosyltransferase involved in cell wall biosynthesis
MRGRNMKGEPSKIRVDLLFDARHIQQTGIGTYIRAQLAHLEETLAQRNLSLAILADEATAPPVRRSTIVILSEPPAAPMYSMREQKAWDRALKLICPRAIWLPHYPYPFTLFRRSNRRILTFVTVHDTAHLLNRSITGMGWERRMYARAMLSIGVWRCRRIITPSQATATSLLKVASSASVTVAPIPVDKSWFERTDPNLSPVDGRYILYVGLVKRHKNLPTLLTAYAEIARAIPQKLVIAGGSEITRTSDERIEGLAAQLGDRVRVTGRLDFYALRSLVAGADLLVMPSLHEGAGLPPLEAMACRTAVLSSNIPALRETCGDGAEYFNPYDHDRLAQLIRQYCCDDDARADLAERGWSHVTRRQSAISFTTAAEAVCSELDPL